ncbi:hypothetical protein UlMin_027478 [Ulmus minor]
MEPIEDPSESSSSTAERSEAMDLLEECWFFGNLLNREPRMLRCYSDPCFPSSNKNDLRSEGGCFGSGLLRTPSLPPNIGKEKAIQENYRDDRSTKMTRQRSLNRVLQQGQMEPCLGRREENQERESGGTSIKMTGNQVQHRSLLRTQSLSPSIGRKGVNQEEEMDRKSSRQASPNFADILPPRHNKGIPRYRPPRNTETDTINTEGSKEMRRRFLNGRKGRKSLSDLEFEEVQGFKDLGFTFENKELNPSVVSILPGLQEKKPRDLGLENKARRPYLSEAWMVQSCAPPNPNWASLRSSNDMKAQIKFWVRAVASNVRQEC